MKKTSIPNSITLLRIALSVGLLFIDFRSLLFVILYVICGVTDALDGYIARKLHSETLLGARLDSLADLFMCCMIIITTMKQAAITMPILIILAAVFGIRIANAVISKVKFGKVSSVHTVSNKLTGFLLFVCPLTYSFLGDSLLVISGVFAILSSMEESLLYLTSKTIDLNRKSIFSKR